MHVNTFLKSSGASFCAAVLLARTARASCDPIDGNAVYNGDFECGYLSSWTLEVPDTSAFALLSTPGHTGSIAFEVELTAAPATPVQGVNARITSNQPIPVVAGATYQLTFWTNFSNLQCGFVGVMVNDIPIWTVDAGDHGASSAGSWEPNVVEYVAATDTAVLKFEYLLGPALCQVQTDTITFAQV
ncbi:hypothetical protein BX600DRAFT_496920 [Xylariales sp. PMI_506]|nr:hypothetical protein BX600DRAFT_496920 [Xylariales sp. PMI_506]